jgi:hypothetical protein
MGDTKLIPREVEDEGIVFAAIDVEGIHIT